MFSGVIEKLIVLTIWILLHSTHTHTQSPDWKIRRQLNPSPSLKKKHLFPPPSSL